MDVRNIAPRREWGQAGFMLLTTVIQPPKRMGLLARHVAHGDAVWTSGALPGLCGQLPAIVRHQPFARSGQPLAFAWLYWRRYCELRGPQMSSVTSASGNSGEDSGCL